ncbi:hypothetical protein EVAR_54911_1 [Eumeta japonica]|uniref:Uncharacterized protein n=1 Tax=Eumeta variegata TaxID=151549 RepID=A0A4C1Z1F5_EUMVA|nr:hypothetical protein EVAR_54911_1 [Eumeta japonica]
MFPTPYLKRFVPLVAAEPLPGAPDGYEAELEREHALPTSLPNADILKTNSNPTYHKPSRGARHGAACVGAEREVSSFSETINGDVARGLLKFLLSRALGDNDPVDIIEVEQHTPSRRSRVPPGSITIHAILRRYLITWKDCFSAQEADSVRLRVNDRRARRTSRPPRRRYCANK